jgi:hypothetical protein
MAQSDKSGPGSQIGAGRDVLLLWRHPIRFESVEPIDEKKSYPVCIGGACASPSEDCGGPEAYMEKMDHHRWNPPLDELQLIADAVSRVLPWLLN